MNQIFHNQASFSPRTQSSAEVRPNTSSPTHQAMDSNFAYQSLPSTLLNPPAYNNFDLNFSFASNPSQSHSNPEPPSGPESPSYLHEHSHEDTTGDDESGDFAPTSSSKARTMETRRHKPGARKTPQPQEQILKRRVQNRAAQRSFRERQKEYVHDLEHQVEQLKGEIGKLHADYQELLTAVSRPRIPQWNGTANLSPALTDEMEFGEEVGLETVKMENMWPVGHIHYQGLVYN